jgi:hypothetical protein
MLKSCIFVEPLQNKDIQREIDQLERLVYVPETIFMSIKKDSQRKKVTFDVYLERVRENVELHDTVFDAMCEKMLEQENICRYQDLISACIDRTQN